MFRPYMSLLDTFIYKHIEKTIKYNTKEITYEVEISFLYFI
jgi:hypothetical protein